MKDDRPAPLITLTDPMHPGPLHDVLSSEPLPREPWAPRPLRVAAAGAVVLLTAVALTPYTRAAQRRDRVERVVAASNVLLLDASDGDLGRTDSPEGFTLTNPSREPMHLQSVALDDYPAVLVSRTLAPGATTEVNVPLPTECPTSLPERPSTMTVTYRVRDLVKTTRLTVTGTTAAYRYRAALQNRCLLFLLPEAVSGVVTAAEPHGRGARLTVSLENVSGEATALQELRYADGFVLHTRLPLPIPGSQDFAHPSALQVEVDLAVADCLRGKDFVARYALDDFAPPITAVLVDGGARFGIDLLVIGAPLLEETRSAVARSCP